MPTSTRELGAATYTYLFTGDLPAAVDAVAATGVSILELTTAPPHVDDGRVDAQLTGRIRARLNATGIRPVSLNPTYLDLNLCTVNTGIRRETLRQLTAGLQACHDLEIPMLVLFPGRRHVLAPAPFAVSRDILITELDGLLETAERLGIVIGLENGPTNFLDRAEQVAQVCAEIDRPALRAVFDLANSQMVENPADGLPALLPYLGLVHISDTTAARWQHARVGVGDVDFGAVAEVLDDAGFAGPSIMEIVDLDDPDGALTTSARALARWGWTT